MMKEQVTVDLLAEDILTDEYVLYILENGPWPVGDDDWDALIIRIQNHVLDAFDAVVDGGVAKKFPESAGGKFRIQIDSPSGLPKQLKDLVCRIDEFVHDSSNEYGKGIGNSKFVSSLRVVTGHSIGKFGNYS